MGDNGDAKPRKRRLRWTQSTSRQRGKQIVPQQGNGREHNTSDRGSSISHWHGQDWSGSRSAREKEKNYRRP